jgi:hypothetical protein
VLRPPRAPPRRYLREHRRAHARRHRAPARPPAPLCDAGFSPPPCGSDVDEGYRRRTSSVPRHAAQRGGRRGTKRGRAALEHHVEAARVGHQQPAVGQQRASLEVVRRHG